MGLRIVPHTEPGGISNSSTYLRQSQEMSQGIYILIKLG